MHSQMFLPALQQKIQISNITAERRKLAIVPLESSLEETVTSEISVVVLMATSCNNLHSELIRPVIKENKRML